MSHPLVRVTCLVCEVSAVVEDEALAKAWKQTHFKHNHVGRAWQFRMEPAPAGSVLRHYPHKEEL